MTGIMVVVMDLVEVAEDVMAVGVPLISPVDVSSERPAGREGETDQESTWPLPYRMGEAVDMAVPLVKVNEDGE